MTDVDIQALDARLKLLLPEEYRDSYEEMQPKPMGSAPLKYDADGQVAWDQIWGSFCDLAMAGGPPHKGTLLGPGIQADIDAQFDRYDEVANEICRGIRLATGLRSYASPTVGWVCVTCLSDAMAEWLVRAIVMENVAARRRGAVLELPASPHFRLEKEIKNVITVIAKTCHCWLGHMPGEQQRAIAELFTAMAHESPLVEPDFSAKQPSKNRDLAASIADRIRRDTGLERSARESAGWIGLECGDIRSAVWMMRALVAGNVLARREETTLFVPINAQSDPGGRVVAKAVSRVHRFAEQCRSSARTA